MTFNPFKLLIEHLQKSFQSNSSNETQVKDQELECLQFGICNVQVKSPRPEELFFR